MKNRNLVPLILLTLVTLGFYAIYWLVITARELRAKGADIPNSILMIIPIISLLWFWKYSQGVEKVAGSKYSAVIVFILFIFTGIGGQIISQLGFNEVSGVPAAPAPMADSVPANPYQVPAAPVSAAMPAATAPQPPAPSYTAAAPVETPPVVPPTQPAAPQPTAMMPPPSPMYGTTVDPAIVTPQVAAAPPNPVQIPDPVMTPPPTSFEPSVVTPTTPPAQSFEDIHPPQPTQQG
jgi:hypothetical protein